jgi:hypothetical protein
MKIKVQITKDVINWDKSITRKGYFEYVDVLVLHEVWREKCNDLSKFVSFQEMIRPISTYDLAQFRGDVHFIYDFIQGLREDDGSAADLLDEKGLEFIEVIHED